MPLLLEPRGFGDTLLSILDEIKNQGIEYLLMDYRPFEATEIEPLRTWAATRRPVFFGSIGAARWLQRNIPEVVVLADFKNFECTSYYPTIGDLLWNYQYLMLPFGDILRQFGFLIECFGQLNSDLFIRPNDGIKSFTGSVVCSDRIATDLTYFMQCEHVRANTLCVVAPYKMPHVEYRCWIADGRVVAASQYRRQGRLAEVAYTPAFVSELAEKVAKSTNFLEPYVLDIATTHLAESTYGKYGEIKVLEANSFSCSGFYAADVKAILRAALDFADKDNEC